MPKRLSDRQRIVGYAMQATEDQLQDAIEMLRAIQTNRFPRQAKKPATARKTASKQPVGEKFTPDPHMVAAIKEGKGDEAPF